MKPSSRIWTRYDRLSALRFLKCSRRSHGAMLTYWKGHNLIHFAASKKLSGALFGRRINRGFEENLADYDVSKGTIRLPYNKILPKDLIEEIATCCYRQYAK